MPSPIAWEAVANRFTVRTEEKVAKMSIQDESQRHTWYRPQRFLPWSETSLSTWKEFYLCKWFYDWLSGSGVVFSLVLGFLQSWGLTLLSMQPKFCEIWVSSSMTGENMHTCTIPALDTVPCDHSGCCFLSFMQFPHIHLLNTVLFCFVLFSCVVHFLVHCSVKSNCIALSSSQFCLLGSGSLLGSNSVLLL